MTPKLVVDASVAIKLFLEEELADEADALFQRLDAEDPPRFYVPDLFFVECANILWKYVRKGGYSRDDSLLDISVLNALPLRSVPTSPPLPSTLALAIDWGLTVYDACYADLANRLSIPLVTADQKLLGKLQASGIDAHWLGALSI